MTVSSPAGTATAQANQNIAFINVHGQHSIEVTAKLVLWAKPSVAEMLFSSNQDKMSQMGSSIL